MHLSASFPGLLHIREGIFPVTWSIPESRPPREKVLVTYEHLKVLYLNLSVPEPVDSLWSQNQKYASQICRYHTAVRKQVPEVLIRGSSCLDKLQHQS